MPPHGIARRFFEEECGCRDAVVSTQPQRVPMIRASAGLLRGFAQKFFRRRRSIERRRERQRCRPTAPAMLLLPGASSAAPDNGDFEQQTVRPTGRRRSFRRFEPLQNQSKNLPQLDLCRSTLMRRVAFPISPSEIYFYGICVAPADLKSGLRKYWGSASPGEISAFISWAVFTPAQENASFILHICCRRGGGKAETLQGIYGGDRCRRVATL